MQPLKNRPAIVVFTDLDGTLLDDNYSFAKAKPIIDQLLALNGRIVFCSNKTRLELEYYREKLAIKDPFSSENGAAIFLPKGYFKLNNIFTKQTQQYDVIELGTAYSTIRQALEKISKMSACTVLGFGDMTAEEVAKDTGLPLEQARLAKQREYTEPFRILNGPKEALLNLIKQGGLSYAQGARYFQLTGNHDKGKVVSILKALFSEEFGSLKTFGVGNESNDLPMLNLVDSSFFVDKTERLQEVWAELLAEVKNLICTK